MRVTVRLRLPSPLYSWCICQQRWTRTSNSLFNYCILFSNSLLKWITLVLVVTFLFVFFPYYHECVLLFPLFVPGCILGSCADLWEIPSWILQYRAGKGSRQAHSHIILQRRLWYHTYQKLRPITGLHIYSVHHVKNYLSELCWLLEWVCYLMLAKLHPQC